MKRSTTPMKRTRLRPRSKKMEAKYAGPDGRRALVGRLLKTRPMCEAGELLAKLLATVEVTALRGEEFVRIKIWEKCRRRAVDVHELLSRSAGGSILDERNCCTTCRVCHTFVGDNPAIAHACGLRLSRYPGRNT